MASLVEMLRRRASRWAGPFRRSKPTLSVAVDTGRGPVVVLLHGIASSSATFANLLPYLRDNRVVAIDLLGFGGSAAPKSATFTLEEHVRYLSATIRRLELDEPFTLVGHSMGGLIASRYAAENPSRVAGLVLVSLPVYLDESDVSSPGDKTIMRMYRWAFTGLREHRSVTLAEAALLARICPVADAFEVTPDSWKAFELSLANTIEQQTVINDLANVTSHVGIIVGEVDPLMAHAGLKIVARMRGVEVERVPFADHLIRGPMVAPVVAAIARTATRPLALRPTT